MCIQQMTDTHAYNTCIEMLNQRGYADIKQTQTENDYLILTAKKQNSKKVCVIFSNDIKLKVERIKEYLGYMEEINCSHLIIIYSGSITSGCKKMQEDFDDKKIELFTEIELTFNITKHKWVPKYTKLSKTESKRFKEEFGLKFSALRVTDPVSRFYGFERGDIVEIEDLDEIVRYRIVK